ncbi:Fic family protein [Fructobacillus fructosus]|uniref:Fic family protein n=1 Tax=Fructobacillus fructosus TaxID=1631 RepID=UPI002DAAC2C9|nr:Fic family protein [Fructobacillus fructosus]
MTNKANKFNFDQDTEQLLFHKATPTILHDGAQFEGMALTILQTEKIVNNQEVSHVKPADIIAIHQMHLGAHYVSDHYQHFNFQNLKELHEITGHGDAPNPGQLRTGKGGVNTNRGVFYPPEVNPGVAGETFNKLLTTTELDAESKAAKIFCFLSRSQLFNDTNKRTALLAANIPLLQQGAGVFYIPEIAMDTFLHMLGDYYYSDDDRLIVEVLKKIAISDFDGKTFYEPDHQTVAYAEMYEKMLKQFKGLGAKGLLGKEKYLELITK